ncbi:VEFS-Box of polycomb protein [Sarocladium implicatum]|nr:VEFS-Box of polycomb protein [Sarocladium implicatum]
MVFEHNGPLPYLSRTLLKWHSSKPKIQDPFPPHLINGNAHESEQPPQKRRRVSPTAPAQTAALDQSNHVSPARAPSESSSFLQLKLHKISRRPRPGRLATSPLFAAGSRQGLAAVCRVTISDDEHPRGKRVLHCQSQQCALLVSKKSAETYTVTSVDPAPTFSIPRYCLSTVSRMDRKYGLCKRLLIEMDLEPGDGPSWPPLTPNSDIGEGYVSVLKGVVGISSSCLADLKELPVRLDSHLDIPYKQLETEYVMGVDARWTSDPSSLLHAVQNLPTPADTNGSPPQPVSRNVVAEHLVNVDPTTVLDDSEDLVMDLDGEPTPSRSLRARRQVMVYNLKDLSDKARGRVRKRDAESDSPPLNHPGQVRWLLPTGQDLCLDENRCLNCWVMFKDFHELKTHLNGAHPNVKFDILTHSGGPTIQVSSVSQSHQTPRRTLSYVRSKARFDTQADEDAEQNGVLSGHGEAPGDEAHTPSKRQRRRDSIVASRKSKASTHILEQERPRTLVPHIPNTPLYHPVSKQLLTPGEELPRPAADKDWLTQKYREALREFTDITPEEKEYMFRWDRFLQPLNVTTAEHLPAIWLSFAEENASWLVEKEYRMLEFSKHASLLFGRSLIKSSAEVTRVIDAARRRKQDQALQLEAANGAINGDADLAAEDNLSLSPRLEHIRKGRAGCDICKLPVRGPRQVLCSGERCLHIYHSTCVKNDARMPITARKWLCNDCMGSEEAS